MPEYHYQMVYLPPFKEGAFMKLEPPKGFMLHQIVYLGEVDLPEEHKVLKTKRVKEALLVFVAVPQIVQGAMAPARGRS